MTVQRDISSLQHFSAKVLSYMHISGIFCGVFMILVDHVSTDINECRSPDDNNCNTSEPAPAECVNVEGGYECVCDQHIGYTLSSDGTACEGNKVNASFME